ncbi:MAG: hypothetical protein A3F11_07195 [Gammaproteobacteria bacterium RIFCSPHIGHO2_12_FULL_37_14]|nr:MAG: hypothetical protein A3F11_07195 [Gammaproteobacteria bacterium RIFCSPHIGHO2_12_FULL_37_14]
MNKLITALSVIFSLIFFSSAMANNPTPNHGVVFQVIQSQIIFDQSTIQSAHLTKSATGVHVILKPAAAKQFSNLTKNPIGKIANIVINGKIINSATINSALGKDMVIELPNKVQAEEFIKGLKLKK